MAITISNKWQVVVNDVIVSEMRESDGYVDATRICLAGGKEWSAYFRIAPTKAFMRALAATLNTSMVALVKRAKGANGERHTLVHPRVAAHLAQWVSPEFAVAVTDLVLQYYCGLVTLPVPEVQLPPADIRLFQAGSLLQALGVDLLNPRINAGAQDWAVNLMGFAQPRLGDGEHSKWRGVVEVAMDMGHAQAVKPNVRCSLGRFVRKHLEGIESTREQRLCNHTMRKVWVYKESPELREVIDAYFARRAVLAGPSREAVEASGDSASEGFYEPTASECSDDSSQSSITEYFRAAPRD